MPNREFSTDKKLIQVNQTNKFTKFVYKPYAICILHDIMLVRIKITKC